MMVFLLYVIPVILTYCNGNFQTEVYDGGMGGKVSTGSEKRGKRGIDVTSRSTHFRTHGGTPQL